MKRILLLAALTLALIASGLAQIVTVDYLVTANNTILDDEVVTVTDIPLVYSGVTYAGQLNGVRPDSVRLEWRATATGDSIKAEPAVAVDFMGSGLSSYVVYDTVKVAGLGTRVLPRSVYAASDVMAVKITARAAGNTLTGANKLWLQVRQFFTLPKR